MKNVPNVPCHKNNPERTAFPAVQAASAAQAKATPPTTIERLGQSVTIDKLARALRWYAGVPRGKGLGPRVQSLTHREQLEDDGGAHARNVLKELGLTILILLFASLYAIGTADASTCFADKYGVYRHTPGSWASWTRQIPGHVGEKCYYPTTKAERHNHGTEVRHHRPEHKISLAHGQRPDNAKPQSVHSRAGAKLFTEFLEWERRQQLYEMGLPK